MSKIVKEATLHIKSPNGHHQQEINSKPAKVTAPQIMPLRKEQSNGHHHPPALFLTFGAFPTPQRLSPALIIRSVINGRISLSPLLKIRYSTRRIFLLYNLLNSLVLFLVPKKLRIFLPTSWFHPHQTQEANLVDSKTSSKTPGRSLVSRKRMESAEMKRVFQMFDRNGDGRITKTELNDSLENLGIYIPDKDLAQMIEKIDVNGDGCVDIDEFRALYESIMEEKDEDEDMKEAFNVFDQNGDGFITVDELKSVLGSLGLRHGRTVEDCKRMIMKVDEDGDGKVCKYSSQGSSLADGEEEEEPDAGPTRVGELGETVCCQKWGAIPNVISTAISALLALQKANNHSVNSYLAEFHFLPEQQGPAPWTSCPTPPLSAVS
ncbi:Calmodulin-like protein 5 [Vitis vinifera]|uniref:Calmodulin-like protein 5 n=1 Tax=Vitis vinifera TaxID=29760 RepID=A0A438DJY0_VITVI|nr:Calmodulin-like protein 5 [Vitis vinifera]